MFRKQNDLYIAESLAALPWLQHGFGTRRSDPPADVTSLKQIHSAIVVHVRDERDRVCDGDALVTDVPGKLVGIRTADCTPILIADPEHRAVAAIHAGWRGTVARIVVAAVDKMRQEFGSRPEALIGAIGPAIGPCCYEVGPEVAEQFRPIFPDETELRYIDLPEANRRLLVSAGVVTIETLDLCTRCGASDFHSYRREGDAAGRMTSFIGLR